MTTTVTAKKPRKATVDITGLSAEEAADKLRETLGAPILLPTDLQLHRCCAKKSKKDAPTAQNGVVFRRVGNDVVAYAANGIVMVRVLLEGDAELVPETGLVMPAKAAKLIADAEEDSTAALWFTNGKVRIAVDGELHEFRLIDALAFDGEQLFAESEKAQRAIRQAMLDAGQLAKLQRAMACEWVEFKQSKKDAVYVLPCGVADGIDRMGLLMLVSSIEKGE